MQDEPNIIKFDPERRSPARDSQVKCARCGKWIMEEATRCDHCGVHFSGEAGDFRHPTDRQRHATSKLVRWLFVIAVLITLIAFLLSSL